jgi:hypothetical protein
MLLTMGGIRVKNDPASLVGILGKIDDISVSTAVASAAKATNVSR